jgi:hypothetical protein
MISGYTPITVPGESFKINIPVKTMVVGTEFLAIDGTVYEQGRLQKTVGLYEDSNYRVRVSLGSGQNDQKVTGNGVYHLIEAQNVVAQGLTYNHGLSLVSNSGTYYNSTASSVITTVSGSAIIKDFDNTPQVYQYTIDSADTASSDAHSFYFNMQYKPFGFTETTAWADVYTAGLTAEEGPVWIIRNGRNDTVQDGVNTSKGAIPLSVVTLAETPGIYEGNNPAPLDLTAFGASAFDGSSPDAYKAALDFFNTPAVAEAAQYGSYSVVVSSAAQTLPQTLGTHISLGSSSGTVSYPEIKNIMLNFRSTGAQTWYARAYQIAQGANRVSYGEGITEFDPTLIDLSLSNPPSPDTLQTYYSYAADTAGGVYTITATGTENVTVINSTTTRRIAIASGATANVTLKNASINLTEASSTQISAIGTSAVPAIDVGNTNATLNLTLVGNNTLKGANTAKLNPNTWTNSGSGAGIHVPDSSAYDSSNGATKPSTDGNTWIDTKAKAALTITGGGSLTVWGGSSCAAIGGNAYEGCGKITVASTFTGSITAVGGQQAAGIGGGFLGNGGKFVEDGGNPGYQDPASNNGYIMISGGTVTAYGGVTMRIPSIRIRTQAPFHNIRATKTAAARPLAAAAITLVVIKYPAPLPAAVLPYRTPPK